MLPSLAAANAWDSAVVGDANTPLVSVPTRTAGGCVSPMTALLLDAALCGDDTADDDAARCSTDGAAGDLDGVDGVEPTAATALEPSLGLVAVAAAAPVAAIHSSPPTFSSCCTPKAMTTGSTMIPRLPLKSLPVASRTMAVGNENSFSLDADVSRANGRPDNRRPPLYSAAAARLGATLTTNAVRIIMP